MIEALYSMYSIDFILHSNIVALGNYYFVIQQTESNRLTADHYHTCLARYTEPVGGSKLEKAVNYAQNHKDTLRNYLEDGRCELSNNKAERGAKSYAIGRKASLFHTSVDGATASGIIYSLVETAKTNNLNVFQYIYTLLLYMPGYKNRPEGIEQLLPWSDFIKEHCSGLIDVETITVEEHPALPI